MSSRCREQCATPLAGAALTLIITLDVLRLPRGLLQLSMWVQHIYEEFTTGPNVPGICCTVQGAGRALIISRSQQQACESLRTLYQPAPCCPRYCHLLRHRRSLTEVGFRCTSQASQVGLGLASDRFCLRYPRPLSPATPEAPCLRLRASSSGVFPACRASASNTPAAQRESAARRAGLRLRPRLCVASAARRRPAGRAGGAGSMRPRAWSQGPANLIATRLPGCPAWPAGNDASRSGMGAGCPVTSACFGTRKPLEAMEHSFLSKACRRHSGCWCDPASLVTSRAPDAGGIPPWLALDES